MARLVGTGLAYYCWFLGLRRMPAGAVSLIGLVNPVVGTLLGVAFAGELFGWTQALGMVLVLGGVLAGQPAVQAMLQRTPAAAPHGALSGHRRRASGGAPRRGRAPGRLGRVRPRRAPARRQAARCSTSTSAMSSSIRCPAWPRSRQQAVERLVEAARRAAPGRCPEREEAPRGSRASIRPSV